MGPDLDKDDWIDWHEGYAPPSPELRVDVQFRDGYIAEGTLAETWRWGFIGSVADIVAYRVATPNKEEIDYSDPPCSTFRVHDGYSLGIKSKAGWVGWDGGDCPELLGTIVKVVFRNGAIEQGKAGWYNWHHKLEDSDIVSYRVLSIEKKTEIEDYFDTRIALAKDEQPSNKYLREYPYDTIDIYRVLQIYDVTDPCIQHAVKKLLCAGKRGYKEVEKDVEEAIQSLVRYQEMRKEEASQS